MTVMPNGLLCNVVLLNDDETPMDFVVGVFFVPVSDPLICLVRKTAR